MVCWEAGSEQQVLACLSLVAVVMYALSAALISPFFLENYSGRNQMVYTKHYQSCDRVLKTLVVLFDVFVKPLGDRPFMAYLGVCFVVNAVDAGVLAWQKPCSLPAAAVVKLSLIHI